LSRFAGARRQSEVERCRHMVVDWSAVTEPILRRARKSLGGPTEADLDKPLGELATDFRKTLMAGRNAWDYSDRPRMYAALNRLES
jgi:hypothetical protein